MLKVEANGDLDQAALYTLSLAQATALGVEVEPNGSLATASSLAPATPRQGRIFSAEDEDDYSYVVNSPSTYTLTFTPTAATFADYSLEVVNASGTVLSSATSTDGAVKTLSMKAKTSDTFYLRVKSGGDVAPSDTYTVSCEGDLSALTTTTTTEAPTTTTTTVASTTTTTLPTVTNSLALTNGWTLLSSTIPFEVAKTLSGVTSVWKWDGGVWAVALPGAIDQGASYAGNKGFKPLKEIASGEGFWVNSLEEAKQVKVTGAPEYGALSLGKGWNLVGLKATSKSQVAELAKAYPGLVSVWKWQDGKWAVNLPGIGDSGDGYAKGKGFIHLTEINPGEGFWVNQ